MDSLLFPVLSTLVLAILFPLLFYLLTSNPKSASNTSRNREHRNDIDMHSRGNPPPDIQINPLHIFRFIDLPEELSLWILTLAARSSQSTYHTLLFVSREMQDLTHRAGLPEIPVMLRATHQLTSFHNLIETRPHLTCLVRHLWIILALSVEEETTTCANVINACTEVRSLACSDRVLKASIAQALILSHTQCTSLTVGMGTVSWEHLLETPSGQEFLNQLTHLRVTGRYNCPKTLRFKNLTHLSFPSNPRVSDRGVSNQVSRLGLSNDSIYPVLRHIVITKINSRLHANKVDWNENVIMLTVPEEWNERLLWRDATRGKNIWDRALKAIPKRECTVLVLIASPDPDGSLQAPLLLGKIVDFVSYILAFYLHTVYIS